MANFFGSWAFAPGRSSSLLRVMVLFFSFLLAVVSFAAAQPSTSDTSPSDLATFRVCTTGQPRGVDPARAYDTASGELVFNVYETLVSFSDKPVLPSTATNVSAWGYSDLGKFEPMLAGALPTISEDRLNWTFNIRSGVKFHPWRATNGTLMTDQVLTAEDVEYAFKRMLVQDQMGGPLVDVLSTGNRIHVLRSARP